VDAIRERDALAAALETERQAAVATQAAVAARTKEVDAARAKTEGSWRDAEARAVDAIRERDALAVALETERQAVVAARATVAARTAEIDAIRANAEGGWQNAEARAADAIRERDALAATLETERQAALAAWAEIDARVGVLDAARAEAVQAARDAESRADEATDERDALAALLDKARESVQGMNAAVDERLAAIDAKRARTVQACEAAEARADAASRERDALAVELNALRQAPASDAGQAQRLDAANERIRALEVLLAQRDRGLHDRVAEPASHRDVPSPPPDPDRRAKRHGFPSGVRVRIDGEVGVLIDLSITGAQVVYATAPEVGRVVTVTLPSDEVPCSAEGRLLWARRGPASKRRPLYRAGIVFTAVDEEAIGAFIARHSAG